MANLVRLNAWRLLIKTLQDPLTSAVKKKKCCSMTVVPCCAPHIVPISGSGGGHVGTSSSSSLSESGVKGECIPYLVLPFPFLYGLAKMPLGVCGMTCANPTQRNTTEYLNLGLSKLEPKRLEPSQGPNNVRHD